MKSSLTDVAGVGPQMEKALAEIGIINVQSLAAVKPDVLEAIRGIGPDRAEALTQAAAELLGTEADTDIGPSPTEKADRLRREAKKLVKEARKLEKKAKSTKSKKKRERRQEEANSLLARAKRKKRKARKLKARAETE